MANVTFAPEGSKIGRIMRPHYAAALTETCLNGNATPSLAGQTIFRGKIVWPARLDYGVPDTGVPDAVTLLECHYGAVL